MKTYETGSLSLGRGTMDYLKFGNGERVFIILPGISLRSVMFSAGAVNAAYKMFSVDYTVYLFDRLRDIPEGCTIKDMAEDTVDAMNALGIDRAYLFGASQGGAMALYLGIYFPERVEKIVAGSAFARINPVAEENLHKWIKASKEYDVRELNTDFFNKIYSYGFCNENRKAFEILADVGTREECERFKRMTEANLGFDIYEELMKIKCPVLVIGGSEDRVLGSDSSTEIGEKLKCEMYIYEDYGHAVYDEAPDYKRRIFDFFK